MAIESAFEMVVKRKALVVDALAAERERVYCSADDDLVARGEQLDAINSEIARMSLAAWEGRSKDANQDSLGVLYDIRDEMEDELRRLCADFEDVRLSREIAKTDIA